MKNRNLFKQKQIPLLGAINQLVGAALAWASMGAFIFSGITAWNTPTVGIIRSFMPWLNIGLFIAVAMAAIFFIMWLQHKYVQSSTVDYWRKMFYDNNPSMKRQKALEQIILNFVIQDDKARAEAKRILDETE